MKYEQPTEAGIYLARTDGYKWWNLIIEVSGSAPWLKINQHLNRGITAISIYPENLIWGPKIEEPEVENND